MASILQAAGVAVVTLGTGAATLTAMNEDMPDLQPPDVAWVAGTELDGMSFHTTDRIMETGDIIEDVLVFRDGTFQSTRCQEYCDFGWSDYRTFTDEDGVIHMTATTRCPDAPHTVVFYGQVAGDEIRFEGTWTTRRWYWTRQLTVEGAGTSEPVATAFGGLG